MKAIKGVKQLAKFGFNLAASQYGEHNRATREAKLWVLMYHRILPKSDPRFALEEPGMVVTPEVLAMHLREAKKLFEMVSLSDWLAKVDSGQSLPAKACAITFDDGWLDNYQYALPILQQQQVPATLFAVADKIGTPFRFWPNIVSELIALKSVALNKHPLLAEAAQLIERPYSVERVAHCIARLKAHTEDELFAALDAIGWSGELASTAPALMDWRQLTALLHSGLIEIGSHTCTHRRLNNGLEASLVEYEITTSKTKLDQQLNTNIALFCFPNGDYNADVLQRVRQTYQAAVTTQRGINRLASLQRHELLRIALHNDASDTPTKFRARLAGWW